MKSVMLSTFGGRSQLQPYSLRSPGPAGIDSRFGFTSTSSPAGRVGRGARRREDALKHLDDASGPQAETSVPLNITGTWVAVHIIPEKNSGVYCNRAGGLDPATHACGQPGLRVLGGRKQYSRV